MIMKLRGIMVGNYTFANIIAVQLLMHNDLFCITSLFFSERDGKNLFFGDYRLDSFF
jgi:hypothetical protein